jgi:hypothetical protein
VIASSLLSDVPCRPIWSCPNRKKTIRYKRQKLTKEMFRGVASREMRCNGGGKKERSRQPVVSVCIFPLSLLKLPRHIRINPSLSTSPEMPLPFAKDFPDAEEWKSATAKKTETKLRGFARPEKKPSKEQIRNAEKQENKRRLVWRCRSAAKAMRGSCLGGTGRGISGNLVSSSLRIESPFS